MIDSRVQAIDKFLATESVGIEWYEHSAGGRNPVTLPALTVRPGGTISLNALALEALGRPARLRIGYSAAHRVIAVRAAKEDECGSFRGAAYKRPGGVYGIKVTSFFKQHNIVITRTTRFQSRRSVDGALLFPLDEGEDGSRPHSHD